MSLTNWRHKTLDSFIFTAFDTETTGLWNAHVVEIAAVKFRADGQVLDEFQTLINPGVRIPPMVTAIHGITNEMVKDSPAAEKVMPRFLSFIEDTVPVAHNASFDVKMITLELMRADLAVPPHEVLDTVRLSRRLIRGVANHQLGTLASFLGVKSSPNHRALADAAATAEIFAHCLRHLPIPSTLGDALSANGTPYSFRRAVSSLQPALDTLP